MNPMILKRYTPTAHEHAHLRFTLCGHLPSGLYVAIPFAGIADARAWCESRNLRLIIT